MSTKNLLDRAEQWLRTHRAENPSSVRRSEIDWLVSDLAAALTEAEAQSGWAENRIERVRLFDTTLPLCRGDDGDGKNCYREAVKYVQRQNWNGDDIGMAYCNQHAPDEAIPLPPIRRG